MIDSRRISENFHTAKVFSILTVTTAHYFADLPLWTAAQIALFVFAFSSGYFTALRYPDVTDVGHFWKAKLLRLGPPLLVINAFLCLVFLLIGREGVFSSYTPLALIGLSGIYDWLGIRNLSAFGNGLWFFTVLLLFYAIYPALARAFRRHGDASLYAGAAVCALGMHLASPPYVLWQTIFGFLFGIYLAQRRIQPRRGWVIGGAGVIILVGLGLNVLHIKTANPYLLIALSVLSVLALLCTALPASLDKLTLPFRACVLEIYLIHTYLFLPEQFGGRLAAFAASLALILLAAPLLHRASVSLDRRLFAETSPKNS